MDAATSIGGTITNGIQDISALLPLLGTEQCEQHLGSALADGFLYSAATPLSIFGSLGMARAGFKVLIASISIPRWRFVGAEKLRDAGFMPSGKNLSLIMIDPEKGCHLAETRLDALLEELHIEDAEKVSVMVHCGTWDLKMAFCTAVLCIIGLVPYVHLNLSENALPLSTCLTFPLIRVLGGFLTATSSQILNQHRLVSILTHRLSFRVLDSAVRSAFQDPDWWNSKTPSEVCLWRLQNHVVHRRVLPLRQRLRSIFFTGIDTTRRWLNIELNCHPDEENTRMAQNPVPTEGNGSFADDLKIKLDQRALAFDILWLFVIFNFIGICASVVGYVGCFSIVQGAKSSKDPIIWLCLEALLSIIRMALWGWNPAFDDLDPIKLLLNLSYSRPELMTPKKAMDKIIEDKTLPMVRARSFLASVTSYAGLFEHFNRPGLSLFYTLITDYGDYAWGNRRALYITILDNAAQTIRVYGPRDNKVASMPEYWSAGAIVAEQGRLQTTRQDIIDPSYDSVLSDFTLRDEFEQHYRSILDTLRHRDCVHLEQDEVDSSWTIQVGDGCSLVSRSLHEGRTLLNQVDFIQKQRDNQEKTNKLFDQRAEWLKQYTHVAACDRRRQVDELKAEELSRPYTAHPSDTPLVNAPDMERCIIEEETFEWYCMQLILFEEMKEWERRLAEDYTAAMLKCLKGLGTLHPAHAHIKELAEEHLTHEWVRNARARRTSRFTRIMTIDGTIRGRALNDEMWNPGRKSIKEQWEKLSIETLGSSRDTTFPPRFPSFSHSSSYQRAFLRDVTRETRSRIHSELQDATSRLNDGIERVQLIDMPLTPHTCSHLVELAHHRQKWVNIKHYMVGEIDTASLSYALKRRRHPAFAIFIIGFPKSVDGVRVAGALKSQLLTSISFLATRPAPVTLAALKEMVGGRNPNLITISGDSDSDKLGPIQETLAQQHCVPNRFTSFCFQGFHFFVVKDDLSGNSSSRVDIRFVGPMEGGLVISIYHTSNTEGQQLELHRKGNIMLTCLVSKSSSSDVDVKFVDKIPLLPDVHFDRGLLNYISVQPTQSGYILGNIDLRDEHGNSYQYEWDDSKDGEDDENEDSGIEDDHDKISLNNGPGDGTKTRRKEAAQGESQREDEEDVDTASPSSESAPESS